MVTRRWLHQIMFCFVVPSNTCRRIKPIHQHRLLLLLLTPNFSHCSWHLSPCFSYLAKLLFSCSVGIFTVPKSVIIGLSERLITDFLEYRKNTCCCF
ncbi:hypothetical protein RIF29_25411 [Crotalaria pallida]|uniref:Uncharacterized protein n=1 Tax=Crotalaria pallida TaxID=3830 RepID=A0AAN9I470_CROPI